MTIPGAGGKHPELFPGFFDATLFTHLPPPAARPKSGRSTSRLAFLNGAVRIAPNIADGGAMETIDVHEAETNFSELLERVHAGEEILITKDGTPCAKLVPFQFEIVDIEEGVPEVAEDDAADDFFEPLDLSDIEP